MRVLRSLASILAVLVSRRAIKFLGALLIAYLCLAYWILPSLWRHYEHHPSLESSPKTTHTAEGIPGDPLNVGTEAAKFSDNGLVAAIDVINTVDRRLALGAKGRQNE